MLNRHSLRSCMDGTCGNLESPSARPSHVRHIVIRRTSGQRTKDRTATCLNALKAVNEGLLSVSTSCGLSMRVSHTREWRRVWVIVYVSPSGRATQCVAVDRYDNLGIECGSAASACITLSYTARAWVFSCVRGAAQPASLTTSSLLDLRTPQTTWT